jgi:hypothetical protein
MLTQKKYVYRRGLGKSVAHGQIQFHLKKQIPSLELEKTLGKRRADAVWEERKIVFEIQFSSITLQEVLNRCRDYSSLGYQIVWILHEGVFNGRKISPAEKFLRASHPTYYTNGGNIYDQIEVVSGRRRLYKGAPLSIEIALPCSPFIQVPDRTWPLHFVGDIHSYCAAHGTQEMEKVLRAHQPARGFRGWLQFAGFRILEFVSTNPK